MLRYFFLPGLLLVAPVARLDPVTHHAPRQPEECFRATGAAETLDIPAGKRGGSSTRKPYRGFVLLEASGQWRSQRWAGDSFWASLADGTVSQAGEFGLNLGLDGSSSIDAGAGSALNWAVFAGGEGWLPPEASQTSKPRIDESPEHRYRIVLHLGPVARRMMLGNGFPLHSTATSSGAFRVTLTPVALKAGVRAPFALQDPPSSAFLALRGSRQGPVTSWFAPGQERRRLPVVRTVAGARRLVFPGTDELSVWPSELPPGWRTSRVSLRWKHGQTLHLGMVGKLPCVRVSGIASPLTFSRFLTDAAVWSPKELNDTRYQLNRHYYSPDTYDFTGLAMSHGVPYVAVVWYSPAASAENCTEGLIFRLELRDRSLRAHVVRKLANPLDIGGMHIAGGLPLVDSLPKGDLLVVGATRTLRMDRRGAWSESAAPAPEGLMAARGRWLVTSQTQSEDASPGFPARITRTDRTYAVLDAVSRKAVCRYHWSTWRYDGKRSGT